MAMTIENSIAFGMFRFGSSRSSPVNATIENPRNAKNVRAMLAMIFTIIVVFIMFSGSLWVMYHLNYNMMPGMTHDMSKMP